MSEELTLSSESVAEMEATSENPPPSGSAGFTPDHIRAPYYTWDAVVLTSIDRGLCSMPVAGPPGTPAAIFQVHAPVGTQLVKWTAKRRGEPPMLPDPDPEDANKVLKTAGAAVYTKELMADGTTHVFTVEGSFLYLLKMPIEMKDGVLYYGGSPADLSPREVHVINPGDLTKRFFG